MTGRVLEDLDIAIERAERTEENRPWNVILHNDDVHSFDEVVSQVQKATGASIDRAFAVTMEAHTEGSAVCYTGPLERCEHVAAILRQIALFIEIDQTL